MTNPTDIAPRTVQRLLIRSSNWIGDAVMTTPAVRAVREIFRDAHITILVKPLFAPVFEHSPRVDRVMLYDDRIRHRGLAGKLRLAADLRKDHFDAALLFPNSFEAAFITAAARIPVRMGYRTDGRGLLLTHAVGNPGRFKQGHHVDYYLGLLRGLGFETENRGLELYTGDREKEEARQILSASGLAGRPLLGISPGATFGPAKQWFPERYAALIDRLCAARPWAVMILGGPGDRETAEKIARSARTPVINLCGRTTVGQAMALVEQCGLFVTNDSGLMHVAASFDIPLVAIFGSTSAVATGPLGRRSRVVQVKMACNPCLKPECPEGHLKCMEQVTVEMVADAAASLLAGESGP
ncbi:MAG: lipopolysaccharide heptosyltransferase II [Thermodesulfobacteriota bacterium]